MAEDVAAGKRVWGKDLLVEQMIKITTNSCWRPDPVRFVP